jgi:hypothetical protein
MNGSTCRSCGASREILEPACPYCGRAYDAEGVYQDVLERRGVVFETRAAKRWLLWAHSNCRLRITKEQLIFDDFDAEAHSFAIPMDELKKAQIESPRGWLGSSDDVLIILEDGTAYEIGLDPGVKPQVLEILNAIWERDSCDVPRSG